MKVSLFANGNGVQGGTILSMSAYLTSKRLSSAAPCDTISPNRAAPLFPTGTE